MSTDEKKTAQPTEAAAVAEGPSLAFTLTRAGDELRVDYTLKNTGKARIYVADQIFDVHSGKRKPAPDRIIVAPGPEPDVARLVRGVVETHTEVEFDYPPAAVHLDPGQTHKGSARLALPLSAWHNYAPADPLRATPRRVVLEIAYLTGEGEWGKVPLADGSSATVPQIGYFMRNHKLARSGPQPIP